MCANSWTSINSSCSGFIPERALVGTRTMGRIQPTTQGTCTRMDSKTRTVELTPTRRHKLPVFGHSVAFVRAGAVIGNVVTPTSQGEAIARHVRAWLAAKADSSPPASHESARPRIAINLIAARSLGIQFPPDLIRDTEMLFQNEDE